MTSNLRNIVKGIQEKVHIYLDVSKFSAAENILTQAIKEHGNLANLHNLLAVTYHKQSKFLLAIKCFNEALQTNPRFIEAALNLSIVYCDLGLYDLGISAYNQANALIQHSEKSPLPTLFLGRLANMHSSTASYYELAGLDSEAQKEYEKALNIYPHMPDIILKLAKLEYNSRAFQKAKTRLFELTNNFAPSSQAFNLLGLIFYNEGDYSRAHSFWTKSQELDSDDRVSRTLIRCLREAPVSTSIS